MDKILNSNGEEIKIQAFHPGQFLKEEIESRKILKYDAAKHLCIKPHHLSEIFAGKRNVSAKLAIRIESLLGIDAEYWMRLKTSYDIYLKRNKS